MKILMVWVVFGLFFRNATWPPSFNLRLQIWNLSVRAIYDFEVDFFHVARGQKENHRRKFCGCHHAKNHAELVKRSRILKVTTVGTCTWPVHLPSGKWKMTAARNWNQCIQAGWLEQRSWWNSPYWDTFTLVIRSWPWHRHPAESFNATGKISVATSLKTLTSACWFATAKPNSWDKYHEPEVLARGCEQYPSSPSHQVQLFW